jgi:hypothetical protein
MRARWKAAHGFPQFWWSVARLLQRRYARDLILLAAFLTAAFLTGFTPGVLIIYASVGLLASLLIWAWKLPARSVVPPLLAAIALSLALSGVQLLPAYELVSHSVGKYRLEWRGTGGGIPWEAFVSLLWPDFYGVSDVTRFRLPYEITTCFLFGGLTPLLLIVFSLHSIKRDRGLRSFVFILLAAGPLMLGDKTIAGLALWSGIPAMVRASYYPQYWLMVFSLAFAIAAGLALDRLSLPVWVKVVAVPLTACELLWVSSGMTMNLAKATPVNRAGAPVFYEDRATAALLADTGSPTDPALPRFDITDETEQWVTSAAPLSALPSANGYDPLALERLIQARLFFAKGPRWGALYKVEQPHSPMLAAMNVDILLAQKKLISED